MLALWRCSAHILDPGLWTLDPGPWTLDPAPPAALVNWQDREFSAVYPLTSKAVGLQESVTLTPFGCLHTESAQASWCDVRQAFSRLEGGALVQLRTSGVIRLKAAVPTSDNVIGQAGSAADEDARVAAADQLEGLWVRTLHLIHIPHARRRVWRGH